jgi:hypothetical protein
LARKLASDEDELEDEEVWNVRMLASCSSAALAVSVDSWVGVIDCKVLPDAAVAEGARALYHCEVGWNMKWDFGLKDTFASSWTLGFKSSACNGVRGAVFEDGVEAGSGFAFFFSFLLDLLRVRLFCVWAGFPMASPLFGLFLTGAAFSLHFPAFFVLDVAPGWPSFRLMSRRNLATSFDRVGYETFNELETDTTK